MQHSRALFILPQLLCAAKQRREAVLGVHAVACVRPHALRIPPERSCSQLAPVAEGTPGEAGRPAELPAVGASSLALPALPAVVAVSRLNTSWSWYRRLSACCARMVRSEHSSALRRCRAGERGEVVLRLLPLLLRCHTREGSAAAVVMKLLLPQAALQCLTCRSSSNRPALK